MDSQAALNIADNDEVLHWARKSGCYMILIGIEAENSQALNDSRKNLNLKRGVGSYKKIFKKMHKHGIGILACDDIRDGERQERRFVCPP